MNLLKAYRLAFWPESWAFRFAILILIGMSVSLFYTGYVWLGVMMLWLLLIGIGSAGRNYKNWAMASVIPGARRRFVFCVYFSVVLALALVAGGFGFHGKLSLLNVVWAFAAICSSLWLGYHSDGGMTIGCFGAYPLLQLENYQQMEQVPGFVNEWWFIGLGFLVGLVALGDIYRQGVWVRPQLETKQEGDKPPRFGWAWERENRWGDKRRQETESRSTLLFGAEYWSSISQRGVQLLLLLIFGLGAWFSRNLPGGAVPLCVAAGSMIVFVPQAIFFIPLEKRFETLWVRGLYGDRIKTVRFLLRQAFRATLFFNVIILSLMGIAAIQDLSTLLMVLNIWLFSVALASWAILIRAKFYRYLDDVKTLIYYLVAFVGLALLLAVEFPWQTGNESIGEIMEQFCRKTSTIAALLPLTAISVWLTLRSVPKRMSEVNFQKSPALG